MALFTTLVSFLTSDWFHAENRSVHHTQILSTLFKYLDIELEYSHPGTCKPWSPHEECSWHLHNSLWSHGRFDFGIACQTHSWQSRSPSWPTDHSTQVCPRWEHNPTNEKLCYLHYIVCNMYNTKVFYSPVIPIMMAMTNAAIPIIYLVFEDIFTFWFGAISLSLLIDLLK